MGECDEIRVCAVSYIMEPFVGCDMKSVSSSSDGVTSKLHPTYSEHNVYYIHDCIIDIVLACTKRNGYKLARPIFIPVVNSSLLTHRPSKTK